MDIRTLQYFVTIVECGNFSSAAKKLHMTQPPLSRQIQNLESELGILLMERGPRNIILTDAGKKLYEYAQIMINLSDIAVRDIQDFSSGKKGQLRIGCASSCNDLLLSIISREFSVKFPDITYQIFEKNTFELIELLEKNIIEIAIVRSPFPNKDALQSEIIMRENFVAVAQPGFFEDENASFEAKELSGKPVILYRRWESFLKNYFKSRDISPEYLCSNDDARTSLAWAKEGMGIALLPRSTVYNIKDQTVLYRDIDRYNLNTDISIAWKNSNYVSHALKNFIDTVLNFKTDWSE